MNEIEQIKKQIEQALAYVHAAIEDESGLNVVEARRNAEKLLPRVATVIPKALVLSDARQLYEYVSQLRALLRILDGRFASRSAASQ
jgi:hypothetical protein